MKRWIVSAVAAFLVAVGFTVAPTLSADAAQSVSVTWVTAVSSQTLTYNCSAGTHTYSGDWVNHASNGCSTRVWFHQYANGSGSSYCLNPGAITYGFGGTYTQILVTNNTAACDAGSDVYPSWDGDSTQYTCVQGATHTLYDQTGTPIWLVSVKNSCNTRVWLHQNTNGSGGSLCVNPNGSWTLTNYYGTYYYQLQISGNQAPCSAG